MAMCLMLILSTIIAPVSAYASSKTTKVMTINVDGARLRSGPGNYSVIKSLKKGTKVLYSGKKTNAFCLVKLSDGTSGYVFRDFLSEYGAVSSSKVYRTTQKAKVYKKPSTSSSKVVTLSKNAFVMVYATKSGWAYVKTVSGKGGYMKLSALTKA